MKLKDKIVAIAYDLFSTNGYDQTSIENIISEVGCSKGGFYHHFKSKEEIMIVVVDNSIHDLKNAIDLPFDKSIAELFDDVLASICQYKLNKFKQEPSISKAFDYGENDRILLSLSKMTYDVIYQRYLELINYGLTEEIIRVKNPQLTANLFTRHLMWLLEEMNKAIVSKDGELYVHDLILLLEETYNRELSLTEGRITIETHAQSYLRQLKELF